MASLNLEHIRPLQAQLAGHPIYGALATADDLRVFMSHHVFSVWDFMSLVKYLQGAVAPVQVPWVPHGDADLRYFINQLVLEEESDISPSADGGIAYASHFEYYCRAMGEVGADAERPRRFVALVAEEGIDAALRSNLPPQPARDFMQTTFGFIGEEKPHRVAAALAFGREKLIPAMFRQFLEGIQIGQAEAPSFHYYLERHITLDEDFHGPLSMKLLDKLCGGDPARVEEAESAAAEALRARLRFWDGVHEAICGR
jgi:hypothetical protein